MNLKNYRPRIGIIRRPIVFEFALPRLRTIKSSKELIRENKLNQFKRAFRNSRSNRRDSIRVDKKLNYIPVNEIELKSKTPTYRKVQNCGFIRYYTNNKVEFNARRQLTKNNSKSILDQSTKKKKILLNCNNEFHRAKFSLLYISKPVTTKRKVSGPNSNLTLSYD